MYQLEIYFQFISFFFIRSSNAATSKIEHSESEYESNVDQDISKLAARTHAEQKSEHSGRRRMQSQQDGESSRSSYGSAVTGLERAAQGVGGFHTVGFDLGVIGSESDHRSASSGHASSGQSRSGQNAATYHSASSSTHQQGGSSRSYSDEDYENVDEYDEAESAKEQDGQSSSWSRTSSYSYAHKQPINAQHATVDHQFKHYPKSKRDTSNVIQLPICKSTECEYVRCVVGPLDKNNGALIALRTRLVAHTLNKVK